MIQNSLFSCYPAEYIYLELTLINYKQLYEYDYCLVPPYHPIWYNHHSDIAIVQHHPNSQLTSRFIATFSFFLSLFIYLFLWSSTQSSYYYDHHQTIYQLVIFGIFFGLTIGVWYEQHYYATTLCFQVAAPSFYSHYHPCHEHGPCIVDLVITTYHLCLINYATGFGMITRVTTLTLDIRYHLCCHCCLISLYFMKNGRQLEFLLEIMCDIINNF